MQTFISITAVSAMSIMLAITNPPPDSIELTGTVRDFKERTENDGHPDFEVTPSKGFGQYCKNISTQLGADQKPVFVGNGKKVKYQATDSDWRPISWTMYDLSLIHI